MRDIKFRGKSLQRGTWVFGNLKLSNNKTYINKWTQYWEDDCWSEMDILVHSNTVGQYTGLKDKNGVEIFEGDIVQDINWNISIVQSESNDKPIYGVVYFGDYEEYLTEYDFIEFGNGWYVRFIGWSGIMPLVQGNIDCIKLIGNIHDNPELLEVEK